MLFIKHYQIDFASLFFFPCLFPFVSFLVCSLIFLVV